MSEILNNYYSSPNLRTCPNVQNGIAQNKTVSYQNSRQYPDLAPLSKDTVSFGNSEKTKKEGMSKGVKWLIGLGLTALAGIGIYIATKGKSGTKQVKQLAEHIDFKEAKTMEEAKKFAWDNFGMKLELEDNLFYANLVNDTCTTINNSTKGRAKFPKKCCFVQAIVDGNVKAIDGNASGAYQAKRDIVSISKTPMTHNGKRFDLISWLNEDFAFFNNSYTDTINKSKQQKAIEILRKTLAHEIGHCNHHACCKDYQKMIGLEELKSIGGNINDSPYLAEFLKEVNNSEVIKNFHRKYALSSPAEFVADTFADKVMGKSIPKEVWDIYIKYGGPNIF